MAKPCLVCSTELPDAHPIDLCGRCISDYRSALVNEVNRKLPILSPKRDACLTLINSWKDFTREGLNLLRLSVCDNANIGIEPEEWQEEGRRQTSQQQHFLPTKKVKEVEKTMLHKVCPNCSKEFPAKRAQKFCSVECRDALRGTKTKKSTRGVHEPSEPPMNPVPPHLRSGGEREPLVENIPSAKTSHSDITWVLSANDDTVVFSRTVSEDPQVTLQLVVSGLEMSQWLMPTGLVQELLSPAKEAVA